MMRTGHGGGVIRYLLISGHIHVRGHRVGHRMGQGLGSRGGNIGDLALLEHVGNRGDGEES